MAQIIPIKQLPSQEFSIILNNQNCQIRLYQKGRVYMDLIVIDNTGTNNTIFTGAVCLTNIQINQFKTPLFNGILIFRDNVGTENPDYLGFNNRWTLEYGT